MGLRLSVPSQSCVFCMFTFVLYEKKNKKMNFQHRLYGVLLKLPAHTPTCCLSARLDLKIKENKGLQNYSFMCVESRQESHQSHVLLQMDFLDKESFLQFDCSFFGGKKSQVRKLKTLKVDKYCVSSVFSSLHNNIKKSV